MRLIVLAIGMGLLIANSALAGSGTFSNWELVYEHDGNGVSTFGDINTLIEAVKNGKDIKVVSHNSSGDWNCTLNRTNVDISNTVVTGYYHEIYSNVIDPTATALYHRLMNFTTTGEIRVRYQEASNLNAYVRQPQSWYVNK